MHYCNDNLITNYTTPYGFDISSTILYIVDFSLSIL